MPYSCNLCCTQCMAVCLNDLCTENHDRGLFCLSTFSNLAAIRAACEVFALSCSTCYHDQETMQSPPSESGVLTGSCGMQAPTLYPLFGMGANLGQTVAGRVLSVFSVSTQDTLTHTQQLQVSSRCSTARIPYLMLACALQVILWPQAAAASHNTVVHCHRWGPGADGAGCGPRCCRAGPAHPHNADLPSQPPQPQPVASTRGCSVSLSPGQA